MDTVQIPLNRAPAKLVIFVGDFAETDELWYLNFEKRADGAFFTQTFLESVAT